MPDPNQEDISLRKVEGGIAAVLKFSGKPTEDIVSEKEKLLRSSLLKDGLNPKTGCLLARYNDPGRTWNFIMVRSNLVWFSIQMYNTVYHLLIYTTSVQPIVYIWLGHGDQEKV